MPDAVVLHRHGGPDELRWEPIPLPEPAPGEARLRQTAVGLNYIDVYQRSGLYPMSLPAVIGTVGSAAKVEIARRHGCDHVLVTGADLPARVRQLTGGDGAMIQPGAIPSRRRSTVSGRAGCW